jgi:hypothetical protein
VNKQEPFQSPAYSEPVRKTERGLGAFISAVTELYGAEQARLSAIDWLDQFESINDVSGFTTHDWRPADRYQGIGNTIVQLFRS